MVCIDERECASQWERIMLELSLRHPVLISRGDQLVGEIIPSKGKVIGKRRLETLPTLKPQEIIGDLTDEVPVADWPEEMR